MATLRFSKHGLKYCLNGDICLFEFVDRVFCVVQVNTTYMFIGHWSFFCFVWVHGILLAPRTSLFAVCYFSGELHQHWVEISYILAIDTVLLQVWLVTRTSLILLCHTLLILLGSIIVSTCTQYNKLKLIDILFINSFFSLIFW